MKLTIEFTIKEIKTEITPLGDIVVQFKTMEKMNKPIIETLLKYTELKEIAKLKMIECVHSNESKIKKRLEHNKMNGKFVALIAHPAMDFSPNGKSIVASYHIGTNITELDGAVSYIKSL